MVKMEKRGEQNSPRQDPLRPYASDYDLHEMAGGLPFSAITAPNVH